MTPQIADRRKELGLSRKALAELTGTTQSAIARLERWLVARYRRRQTGYAAKLPLLPLCISCLLSIADVR